MKNITIVKKIFNKKHVAKMLGLVMIMPAFAMADYPEKPITLIVPWAAGGGTDATARTIATAMEKELGQTVNVINRTGGSGVVGHTAMAMAKPDGYTLGLITGEINMMHWQGLTKLTYKDYTPIAQINYDYTGIQVADEGPFDSLQSMITKIKESPAHTYNASGTGQGGVWHLAFAGFLLDQGLEADRVSWIPSQGSAPAMTEMAAGTIDIVPSSVPEGRSMVDAGKVKSLAVMSPKRLDTFPNVPTIKESIDSDYQIGEWRGIAGPKGMDPDTVNKLEKAIQASYNSSIYQDFMKKQGFGTEWRNAKDFQDFMIKQDVRFGEIVKKVGLEK